MDHQVSGASKPPAGVELDTTVIIAVVVTYDRPLPLRGCLHAVREQRRPPDHIVVVDDASPGTATASVVAAFRGATHLRHATNHGGAAAYRTGIAFALAAAADLVWLKVMTRIPPR